LLLFISYNKKISDRTTTKNAQETVDNRKPVTKIQKRGED